MVRALLLAGALSACANLSPISTGVCGNGVVEAGEDCDTFAPDSASRCREPGAIGACHLDCAATDDGARGSCPPDWGCQSDGICRPPTGEFVPFVSSGLGRGAALMSGDFDGDRRADALSLEPPDNTGFTRMEFLYFDSSNQVADVRPFPKELASPVVSDLTGDGIADVAFAERGIGLLRGRNDRGFIPDTFGTYRLPDHGVRMFGVSEEEIEGASALVALTTLRDEAGIYVPEASVASLRLVGTLPVEVEGLAGEPAVGDLIEDPQSSPCRELVYAVDRANEFSIVDLCTRDDTGAQIWREHVQERIVKLPPDFTVQEAPRLADVDGDGHLDVLLGAEGQPLVFYGDGREVSEPHVLDFPELANDSEGQPLSFPLPLAVGDVSGDGAPDFVFPRSIYLSYTSRSGETKYEPLFGNDGAPWTQAQIDDFNRDGHPDIVAVAARRLNLDFFNGQSGRYLPLSSVVTAAPVERFAVGDFDGDLVNDIAFAEAPPVEGKPGTVRIAFGRPAGAPDGSVPIASVRGVEQLGSLWQRGIGNLVIASDEGSGENRIGVLTLMQGSSDRLPLASYSLTSFEQDRSIEDYQPVSLVLGSFLGQDSHDVVALSYRRGEDAAYWDFWVAPAMDQAERAPARLAVAWDPRLAPLAERDGSVELNVAAAGADLDGDASTDAVFAMPADDGTACGIVSLRHITLQTATRDVFYLAEPCPRTAPALGDLDADGAPDLVLVVGSRAPLERRIKVLWNDGAGAFSPARATYASNPNELVQQFAFLPGSLGRAAGLVYITQDHIWRVAQAGDSALFSAPRLVGDVPRGAGITVADFDGDNVFDIAAIGGGDVTLFKASLEELR